MFVFLSYYCRSPLYVWILIHALAPSTSFPDETDIKYSLLFWYENSIQGWFQWTKKCNNQPRLWKFENLKVFKSNNSQTKHLIVFIYCDFDIPWWFVLHVFIHSNEIYLHYWSILEKRKCKLVYQKTYWFLTKGRLLCSCRTFRRDVQYFLIVTEL